MKQALIFTLLFGLVCLNLAQIPHCIEMKDDNCVKCERGWGVYDPKTCKPCFDYACLDCCDNFKRCKECRPGSWNEIIECLPCDLACETCGSSTAACTSCKDKNCKSCYGDRCLDCPKGFFPNNVGRCTKCGRGCESCKDDKSCQTCLDKNCESCDIDGCITCKRGFFPNSNGECLTCGEACEVCNDADSCLLCRDPHCQTCSHTSCISCKDQWFSQERVCQKCANVCATCSSADKCDKCVDPKCEICGVNGAETCQKCEDDFYFDAEKNICGGCISSWKEPNKQGNCDFKASFLIGEKVVEVALIGFGILSIYWYRKKKNPEGQDNSQRRSFLN